MREELIKLLGEYTVYVKKRDGTRTFLGFINWLGVK